MPASAKGKLDITREKDKDLLNSCSNFHLFEQLKQVKPKLLIPMGVFACYALDPTINLELDHGIPRYISRNYYTGWVFPMYHPAGGIHEPKKMLQIRTDWTRLRKYILGRLRVPVDPYAGKENYEALSSPDQVDELLSEMWDRPLACDTETTGKRKPYCLTFSVQPGTGYLIHADDTDSLLAFQNHINKWSGVVLFHNWLFDSGVVDRMGLAFPRQRIVDTMVKVFHLGNLPQGLKALSYRLSGMKMQDFDDLVAPYSTERVLTYYRWAYNQEWPRPEKTLVRGPDGKLKEYHPQSMKTKLKRFFTDYTKKGADKDVFKMWTDNWEEYHAQIESVCGEWPGKCITHVPPDKILFYSCRDADALIRLWPILRRMERQVRRKPQELWGEAA
jgi:hypothetical protein